MFWGLFRREPEVFKEKARVSPGASFSEALKYLFAQVEGWELVEQGRGGSVLYRSESRADWVYVAYNPQTGIQRMFPVSAQALDKATQNKHHYEAFLARERDRIRVALDQ